MDSANQQPSQECLLIYDGRCRFCLMAKEAIEERDEGTGARFVKYEDKEAEQRLGPHYSPGDPDVAFLVEADGTVRRGLDAFVPLLPRIRGGRFILFLLRLPFGRAIGKLAYGVIARYRYRWFGTVGEQERP